MKLVKIFQKYHLIDNISNCVVLKNNETEEISHVYMKYMSYIASEFLYNKVNIENKYSFIKEYYTYCNEDYYEVFFKKHPPNLHVNRKEVIINPIYDDFLKNHSDFEINYKTCSHIEREEKFFKLLLTAQNKFVDVLITLHNYEVIESIFIRENEDQIIKEMEIFLTMIS